MRITAVVLTYNEERRIRECLQALKWADAILVVDGESTDGTPDIAREFTDSVISSDRLGPKNPGGFAEQRNFALSLVNTPWVFFVDADEICTAELGEEIRKATAEATPEIAAFRVRRDEHFFGIRSPYTHGSSCLVRLARTAEAKWDNRLVHEGLEVNGTIAFLENRLIHRSKETLAEYLTTQNRYTTLEAEEARRTGLPLTRTPLFGMLRTFCNLYFYKGSYREGSFGLLMSLLMTYYSFLCWAKRWELEVKEGGMSPNAPAPQWIELPARALGRIWNKLRPPVDDRR